MTTQHLNNSRIRLVRLDLQDTPRMFRFPLPVMNLGTVTEGPSHFIGRHENQIEFCIRMNSEDDVAVDTVGETVYANHFPHVFVKHEGPLHEYHYPGVREAFFFIYHVSLHSKLEEMGVDLSRICWEITLSPTIMELIRELVTLFPVSQESGIADRIDTLCWRLLQEIIICRRSTEHPETEQERKIRQIASYIQYHYKDPFDMDQLISENGMSRRTFFRHWKQFYSKTPAQQIQDLKMKEARRLLGQDQLSIADIAAELGFIDSAYFICTYRRYYGITPLQFRKKLRN